MLGMTLKIYSPREKEYLLLKIKIRCQIKASPNAQGIKFHKIIIKNTQYQEKKKKKLSHKIFHTSRT